jgi:hypothetical protein
MPLQFIGTYCLANQDDYVVDSTDIASAGYSCEKISFGSEIDNLSISTLMPPVASIAYERFNPVRFKVKFYTCSFCWCLS